MERAVPGDGRAFDVATVLYLQINASKRLLNRLIDFPTAFLRPKVKLQIPLRYAPVGMTKEKEGRMGRAIRMTNLKLLTQCMICHPDRSGGICSFVFGLITRAHLSSRVPGRRRAISGDIDGVNAAGVLNIVERILVEHDQIGPLACLERAQVLGMQERGGIPVAAVITCIGVKPACTISSISQWAK
jgi:hypothetical protein